MGICFFFMDEEAVPVFTCVCVGVCWGKWGECDFRISFFFLLSIYKTLFQACIKEKEVEQVGKIIADMDAAGVVVDKVTKVSLLEVFPHDKQVLFLISSPDERMRSLPRQRREYRYVKKQVPV